MNNATGGKAQPGTKVALWLCLASVGISLALRALYFAEPWRLAVSDDPIFSGDEGVFGLMARHIFLHGDRPLFFYGQFYLGALEAYLAAAAFWVLGDSLTTLRLVPTAFAILWVVLTYAIGHWLYGRRAALLAATLMALPSRFVFEWGSRARSETEHVAFMLVLLYLVVRLLRRVRDAEIAALGLVAGFSLWVNQLAVAFLPVYAWALCVWVPLRRKHVALLVIAGVIGLSPLLYGNIVEPMGTVRALAQKVKEASWDKAIHLRQERGVALFRVLGSQEGLEGRWSPIGTVGCFILVLGLIASTHRGFALWRHGLPGYREHLVLLAVVAVNIAVGSAGFRGQPVGRYQLLLYPLLCLLTVGWLDSRAPRMAIAAVALLAAGQVVDIAVPVASDGWTAPQRVVSALLDKGLHYGYAPGPSQMYDIVFESHEKVVIVPLSLSRYEPYESLVGSDQRLFYIYRDDVVGWRDHRLFTAYLASTGVRYAQMDVGHYHVLYQFEPTERMSPAAITSVFREERERRLGRSRADHAE